MDKLKDDVMQQSKPGKNHLNTNYSGLPLTCSCRDADLCIIILNKEIMDAIKEDWQLLIAYRKVAGLYEYEEYQQFFQAES